MAKPALNPEFTDSLAQSTSPRWMRRVGWAMSGLMILFLLFDGLSKIALEQHVVAATAAIGYPLALIRPLGVICLVCTILYALPRTSLLGAILLTGYLGGAVASKVRIEDPIFSSVLFGVYFGILVWGGLLLRSARLRALFRLGATEP
jgi:DoxX-like family